MTQHAVLLSREAIVVLLEDLGVPVGKNDVMSYSTERDARREATQALLDALAATHLRRIA